MKLFRLLDRALVDYNFFIAFAAVSLLWLVDFQFDAQLQVASYCFLFTSTLLTYNVFRTPYQSISHFWNNRNMRFYIIVGSGFVASICFLQFEIGLQLMFVVLGFLTASYKFSFFNIPSLREIPFLKLPVITAVWVASIAIFFIHRPVNPAIYVEFQVLMYMQVFLFIAITIPFDVFGLIEDEMPTIPNHFGTRKALFFSKIAILIYGMLPLIFGIERFLIPAISVTLITFGVIQFTEKLKDKAIQYYCLDGILIVQTLVYFLFQQDQ